MKTVAALIFFSFFSCLSSGKKDDQPKDEGRFSENQVAVSTSPEKSQLLSECYTIVNGKRHIYNFFRSSSNPKEGSLNALDPVDPLSEKFYIATYELKPKALNIELDDGNEKSSFVIELEKFVGSLKDQEDKTVATFQCDDFLF